MKKILLVLFVSLFSMPAFSQTASPRTLKNQKIIDSLATQYNITEFYATTFSSEAVELFNKYSIYDGYISFVDTVTKYVSIYNLDKLVRYKIKVSKVNSLWLYFD